MIFSQFQGLKRYLARTMHISQHVCSSSGMAFFSMGVDDMIPYASPNSGVVKGSKGVGDLSHGGGRFDPSVHLA